MPSVAPRGTPHGSARHRCASHVCTLPAGKVEGEREVRESRVPHLQSSVNAVLARLELFLGAAAGTDAVGDKEHGTCRLHSLRSGLSAVRCFES